MGGNRFKIFLRRCEALREPTLTNQHPVLHWAHQLYEKSEVRGLEDLSKIILRPLQSRHIADAYFKPPHQAIEELWWLDSLGFSGWLPGADRDLNSSIIRSVVPAPAGHLLNLSTDIILPTSWHPSSIVNLLGRIGSERPLGRFKQSSNHQVTFMIPLGIGWVSGGNHSIAQGIIRGEGEIAPTEYLDVTEIVRRVTFDGKSWRCCSTGHRLGRPRYIELGLVWEISRLIVTLKAASSDNDAGDNDCGR
ncbi:DUF6710 family protein [Pseudomonas oryzihabitans]|uniref:DUF6710 family protein n=1 Tax=Pseudomonas oryzihabitans TaxID=47885 RepID=UPI003917198C